MGMRSLTAKRVGACASDLELYLDRVTIRSVEDIRSAAEVLRDFAQVHGLRAAICADVANKETMVDAEGCILAASVFGWCADGDRWWATRCQGLHSPLARACRYEGEPFWINGAGFHAPFANPYFEAIDLKGYFAASVVCQSAIVVPVHLPFAQVSASSFHPYDREVDDLSETFARIGGMLGSMTRRFVAGYVAANRRKRRIPSACKLTKREVECLQWAAIGKTDREIGLILNLSHAAVRYHIHGAGEKLNSVNRSQTIFKAGQLGFLGANS